MFMVRTLKISKDNFLGKRGGVGILERQKWERD